MPERARALSSVGRASALQAEGRWFESNSAHGSPNVLRTSETESGNDQRLTRPKTETSNGGGSA